MKSNYYITVNAVMEREHNTIYLFYKNNEGENEKRIIPVEKIYTIYCYGNVTIKSGALAYLMKHGIVVHFFNKYGFYEGSFYPRQKLLSGDLLIKQAQHYLDYEKRMELAREFVKGAIGNILVNLKYYERANKDVNEEIKTMEDSLHSLEEINDIKQLMAIEGNAREAYYQAFDKILPPVFHFDRRSRQPPANRINALISFGNSLVYSSCLTEIYNTQLNPTISYLHEPSERRFSLSLDIAEVFKPLLADRVIFKLVQKKIISENDFRLELNSCLLNNNGKKKFLHEYDAKLKTTIKHRGLRRNISYQRLIRLECYKLIKHLLGMNPYKAFKIWW
ncbi:MAG: type I-B CRISPR-associated endonuclease Cas1 [Thermoplasmata archaeon]|nr:type I-B CRISPR-associated endonuclease Cas1 [Thermoplasmata archaeon]